MLIYFDPVGWGIVAALIVGMVFVLGYCAGWRGRRQYENTLWRPDFAEDFKTERCRHGIDKGECGICSYIGPEVTGS